MACLQGPLHTEHSAIAHQSHAECKTVQLVHESRPQVRRDRLLRLPEVEQATGLKKSTVYLLMRRGEFPRCVQITPRCVAWPESAVLQWVQERIAAAQASASQAELLGAPK